MPQPSQVPTLRPSPLPTSTPAPSLEAYYKAGYYYLESYAATDCSGSVSSTIGYALDACVPVSYTDPKSSIKSDLYLRHTCSNNRALATYYRTSACVMGTELSSLESASKLNKCTTVPGAAGASQIHRCTSDLSTLPLVQQSVLVGEYGTSTCDLEPVAFQAVPVGCSGQGTSWVKQYCAGSSNSKVIREVFAGTGCVVSASTSLVSNFTVGPTCLINNDTSLLPQSLNNTLVAYKKTTCFTPQPAEPAVTSGYFSRNGFADADCSGPPVYQDGFRLGKCLPLYSLDGIQTGSFYASCVPTPGSSSSAAQTLTRLTFPNAHCKGAAQSEQAPVDGSSCLASATTHGITEAMHFVYNCSAGSSPPITLPSAVVVGGSDFYNVSGVSSTACESESSYDVFSAYAADDTHFKWDPNHSFSITCSDQTWYNQSDAVMHTLPIDTNRGCYSYEDNADYIKLQNDLHLVQPFLRLKLASTASARQLQASTPAETSPPRALTDPSETPEGYALRTYFSDSGCDDGSPSWYEGFRLNTCIQRFDPATGDSMGSVKYQCLDYSSVTESKYPDTTDCTSTGGGGFGSGGSFEPMPTQNCTAISPLQQASASGLYATLLARAQSEWWTCSPDNTALPVPTTAVVHSGFATNDESCSGAATAGAASAAGVGSLALPNYFSAFPTQRCIPLNGTALQSLRYTCQLGEAKVSTYEGAFCQTLVDTVSDGTGDCSADNVFIGSDMDGASLQKHEATSCYNPSDFGSTENYYYGPSTTAKFVYVNLGCRVAPSVPAPDPTNEPTPSPSPGTTTKRPTANPTSKFRPSARPTPKAPTPRPTAANLVIFGVSQTISGCPLSVVSASRTAYTNALKQSVVDVFNSSAVKEENILNFEIAAAAAALSLSSVLHYRHLQSSTSSLILTYEIKTTAPTTFAALSAVLIGSVSNGKFNQALAANAVKFSAPGLASATAGPVAATDLNPSPGPATASTIFSLHTNDVIGIAVAIVGSCLVCCFCIYRRRKRASSSGNSGGFGRSPPPLSSYGNNRGTGYGYEDDHDSFSTFHRPSSFRDDVPAKTNYAASFNINGNRGKRLGTGGRSFNDGL